MWKLIAATTILYSALNSASAASVDFARDVRPILSQHCFKCHGPDDKARKAKLRLDLRSGIAGEEDSRNWFAASHQMTIPN